ncbi:sugar ABC transporter substrate-binding protein [Dysosmobacter sp.]|uniref:sugar ABC transporter substrate-binding protein n=1 Tax=Dysosmobacter sp. TaxID=2591382 RepID=UPI002A9F02DA|nr:sugar ABC transporter substrate-binding protein [Dysosmobacter sp.]MDY5510750.1 sugar ABC transporter substrate-binding protein [Dysosmobacter sp.]
MKKGLALLLTLALCLSLAACGGSKTEETPKTEQPAQSESTGGAEKKTLTIALLPKTLSNPYFVAMQKFAEETAAQLSNDECTVEIVCSAPPSEDGVNEQITMFESYLEKGVDGVLVVPCGTAEVVDTIKKANAKNVPVICLDTNADAGADVAAFIGTNNYDGGFLAGEWTAKNINGQVAVITGTLGNQCHTDRTNGYMDGLNNASNIELVGDIQPCNGDQGTAMGIAENLLTAYPDLKCIYVTSDTGAMGAATAVQATGRDVKVIGFDGSPNGAQSILDGGMTATVAQTPGVMAQEGVKALYELLINGTAPKDMYTPCSMVTEENANDYLDWH